MVVFAIETVTRRGSMALLVGDAIASMEGDAARSHSQRLPGDAIDWLAARRRSLADVDRFAVVTGPGSFTGLRVGLATVQGWAAVSGTRIVPVTTFEALIEDARDRDIQARGGVIAACTDGQRGETFVAVYDADTLGFVEEAQPIVAPISAPAVDAARMIRDLAAGRPSAIVGDAAARVAAAWPESAARADMSVHDRRAPLSVAAARIAERAGARAVGPHALRPVYVRRPDAEIARDRLRSTSGHPAGDEDDRARAAASPRFRVRRAGGETDLAAVEALQRETFTNPWGAGAIRWELEHTDVARLYLLDAPEGGVIGYCACWIVFDELHINSLAIDAAWRRRGAATHLLESVFAETIRAGARTATLEVRASNVAARRLYERLGFRVEATRRDYYQQPREDALILWCRDLAGRTPAARPA